MSLARAFTSKRTKPPQISSPMPQRSLTTSKQFPGGTIRHKISGPVELISTTNMLSYNAPDLYPSSSSSSHSGDDDSEGVPALSSSPATSPDNSSAGSSPTSPEPNHLSCYFGAADGRTSTSSNEDAPVIPQRALSHTKKTHEALSRKLSQSRLSASRLSSKNSVTSFPRGSADMFSAAAISQTPLAPEVEAHPFGNELAQVTELAEEYSGSLQVVDEEERELLSRGLFKFDAQDYMAEIQGFFTAAFVDGPLRTMWI